MRMNDDNRAEKYIKKHENFKKWVAFALCLSLLTGTATLYMLNKPATAMTEDGAKQVGLVLETADSDWEAGMIENMDSGQATEESENSDVSEEDLTVTEDGAENSESSEAAATETEEADAEDAADSAVTEGATDAATATSTDEAAEATSTDGATDAATTASTDGKSTSEASSLGSSGEDDKTKESTDKKDSEKKTSEKAASEKSVSEKSSSESKGNSSGDVIVEYKKDAVITVFYEDIKGESLAESKELSITESFNLEKEARSFEGYHFSKGTIGETQIVSLTKMTKEAAVTITESAGSEENSDGGSAETTATSDDTQSTESEGSSEAENSEDADSEEQNVEADETAAEEGSTDSAFVETDTENTETETNAESNTESSAEIPSTSTFVYYEATTVSGEKIEITENAELHLSYYKVNTKTEFVNDSNSKVTVKAVLTDPGALLDGVQLVVSEINSKTEGYNYDAYMEALNENAEAIAGEAGLEEKSQYTDTNTLMYDIAFMYEGKEYQPAEGSVNISIEFKEKQLSNELSASSNEDITVVHLPIKEEVKEASEITSTQEATEITAKDIEVKTLTEASAEVSDTEKIEFTEESFSIFAVTVYQKHTAGTHDYELVLGDAINFGLVAENLVIGESQSNFATVNLTGTKQSGNNLTNPVEQTFMAAYVNSDFKVKNNSAYFIVPEDFTYRITHENQLVIKYDTAYCSSELETAVKKMLEYGRNASKDLAKNDSNISIEADGNRDKIDLRNLPGGTYYVNLKDVKAFFAKQEPRIYKNSNQIIVFNVTDPSSSIDLYKYFVSTDGGALVDTDTLENNGQYDSVNRTIIWNFINADTVTSRNSVAGVFISGKEHATWNNEGTSAGWLVFPNINIGAGEWHNTNQNLKQISGTAQFQAYKNIDGEAATVSGFGFKLSLNTESGWKDIQYVTNDEETPHNITFATITYGDLQEKEGNSNYQYVKLNLGESKDFVYVIDEVAGTTDVKGNAYHEDDKYYFAKVTVTCERQSSYTDSTYYRVSAPKYYKDFECTQPIEEELPTFNNTTSKGSVGIKLYKYLNDQNPGDKVFSFTVRALMSDGSLKNLTETVPLNNVGADISYSFDYDSTYITLDNSGNKRIYLVITEDDIDNTDSELAITKDKDYIIARIDLEVDGAEAKNIYYFKYDYEDVEGKSYIDMIESGNPQTIKDGVASGKTKKSANKISDEKSVAFYNTGEGLLRIHKMVVNDFGSGFVRNNTGTALLQNVVFRITNNATGNYIWFKTFTGKAGQTGTAYEYDGKSHQFTGKEYVVTYNQSAQWTIAGLSVGTYTVDEVADGLTFEYYPDSNTSGPVTTNNLSRVTKYDLTEDKEDGSGYGTGGNNYRVVFSSDLKNHNEFPPSNVVVGGKTQTVQVCNYYSIPVGPIEFTKNFSGAAWDENIAFSFQIEAVGYKAYTSEKQEITLSSQPMPQGAVAGTLENVDSKTAVLTIKGNDQELVDMIPYTDSEGKQQYEYVYQNAVKDNGNGSYSVVAKFSSIPFRYEGTYYYKITEVQGDDTGIKYDKSTYYVKIVVEKQYMQFTKIYSYGNMTHPDPAKYGPAYANPVVGSYTNDSEDFYYLAADVIYASAEDFSENSILAKCSLRLQDGIDTVQLTRNEYSVDYTMGGASAVAFNNYMAGNLTVTKKWLDTQGNDISGSRTSLLAHVWQRAGDNGQWKLYTTFTLTPENSWSTTINDLPLMDENGVQYQYTVKEDEQYYGQFNVSYDYDNKSYDASKQSRVDVLEKDANTGAESNVSRKDTGYAMRFNSTTRSFGAVTITNSSVYTNTLPSTGGAGTAPYTAMGIFIILLAFICLIRFKAIGRKKG